MKKKTVIMIGLVLVVGLLAEMILPALTPASNCGGNSYALNACKHYVMVAVMAADDGKSDISKFGEAEKSEAAKLANDHWIGGAGFLVRSNLASTNMSPRVVIVCEKSFDNVPQPTLWNFYRKNPAHAIGYSDGSTGLISPAEFKTLDLTGFVSLSNLATNNSAETVQP